MPTILQLSESTYVNVDQITVLRADADQWRVWLSDPSEPLVMTPDESAVLALYVHNHTERRAYHTWCERQGAQHDR